MGLCASSSKANRESPVKLKENLSSPDKKIILTNKEKQKEEPSSPNNPKQIPKKNENPIVQRNPVAKPELDKLKSQNGEIQGEEEDNTRAVNLKIKAKKSKDLVLE